MHGATPPHLRRIDDLGEDLNGEQAGALGHAGDGLCRGRVIARRNAGDVRAVKAVGQRTGRGRSGTDLLIEPVRAERLGRAGLGLREAGFLHHFSRQERVGPVHAVVQHGDHRAAAVVSGVPCLVGLDERRAVSEHREEEDVVQHAFDVGVEGERCALFGRHFENDEGNRLKLPWSAARPRGQPRQHLRGSRSDGLSLTDDRRRVRQVALRYMSRGQPQLDDHPNTLGRGRR